MLRHQATFRARKRRSTCKKDFLSFWHMSLQRRLEDKSEKKRLADVPIVQDFPEVFPEDLPGLPLTRCSTGTLSIGAFRNERVIGATERAVRQRLYKTQFLTLSSSGLVCQEEGRIMLGINLHMT
ncbi:hypothetical protein Tco_0387717 [Tanacetum coccineum]